MKAIVFDKSGTLVHRYDEIKNIQTGQIYSNIDSINIVDQDPDRVLVVFQTKNSECIAKATPTQTISQFLIQNSIEVDISYSTRDINKDEILNVIKKDKTCMSDVQDTYNSVVDKYNIHICIGSGLIINMKTGKIEYTLSAGGRIFEEVPYVVNQLKERGITIFIASGDGTQSLHQLAEHIKVPLQNVYNTANSKRKKEIVTDLKKQYQVMMVGNDSNDILAMAEADVGVLTVQQNDRSIIKTYAAADYVINNIQEVLNIDF